ncbi:ribonuclease H-like domain-containing protein [Tanacetum coccineum]
MLIRFYRTQVETESKLRVDGDRVSDSTLYRSITGTLWYLTFMCSAIYNIVQQVFLYIHIFRDPHFSALKRILRHVSGTLDYGLHLYSSFTSSFVAYLDADWAGSPTTSRSTSGYYVFLGNNLLSWPYNRQVGTLATIKSLKTYASFSRNPNDESCFALAGPDIAYLTPDELVLVLKPLKVTTVHLPAMINKIQVVAKKSDTTKKNRYTFLVITSFKTTSCENVTTLLRNGSAAENAALLMQEKGASQQEKPRHR